MSDLMEHHEQTEQAAGAPPARGRGERVRAWASGRRRPLAIAAVVLALVAGTATWWLGRGLPGDVALEAEGHRVTVAELHDRVTTLEALYGVTEPADAGKKAQFWRDAAQSVAVGFVMDRAATARGITVSDNVVQSSLHQVVTGYFGSGAKGRAAFVAALGNRGTSQTQVTDEIRRQLVVSRLYADVTGEVPSVTDTQVTAAYAARRCGLRVPERRVLSNVVVSSRADALRVLKALRAGAPIAAVAARASLDGSTRDKGGALGTVGRSDLQPAYARAAFGARRGAFFGPVRTQYGWNVGQVRSIVAAHVPPLAAVRQQLRQELFDEARSAVWSAWLKQQVASADVRYNDAYRPSDPTAVPSAAVPGSAASTASGSC